MDPVFVIGSCNGLLCIVRERDNPFLYNPSTRISKRLPYSGVCSTLRSWYSFGYDESSDDYKVIGLFRENQLAKIYSLKTGLWKYRNDVPHISPSCLRGTFSNGALHWMVRKMDYEDPVWYVERVTNYIVTFDLASETFGELSLPPVCGNKYDEVTLGTLGEWLCVIGHYREYRADLWVMKVYGVEDSWFKLVSIPYYSNTGIYTFYSPVSMSNDRRFLLTLYKKLVVYDSMNCSLTEIHEFEETFEAFTHVDSLVSPHPPLDAEQIEEFS